VVPPLLAWACAMSDVSQGDYKPLSTRGSCEDTLVLVTRIGDDRTINDVMWRR
jgi:hypothetical protein